LFLHPKHPLNRFVVKCLYLGKYGVVFIMIIIRFYFPAQRKTNKDNNSWIQEYAGQLPEKQTLIKLATYLII